MNFNFSLFEAGSKVVITLNGLGYFNISIMMWSVVCLFSNNLQFNVFQSTSQANYVHNNELRYSVNNTEIVYF